MNKLSLAVFICLGIVAGSAVAHESGAYFGTGAGYARSNVLEKGFTYSSTTENKNESFGGKVYGGYSWGTWGVEGGYYHFGQYTIAGIEKTSGQPSKDQYTISAFAVSGVGTFAFAPNWAATTKLGIAAATVKYQCITFCPSFGDQTSTNPTILYGVGVKWNVLRNLALRVDLEGMDHVISKFSTYKSKVNASMLTVGVEANF